MKTFIFISMLLISSLGFAEVKLEGALVPSMCGNNYLEAVSGPDYPSKVCLYSATGNEDALYVGITTSKGEKFYQYGDAIVDNDGHPIGYEMWPVKTKKKSGQILVKSVDESKSAFVLTSAMNDQNQLVLSGPMFEVIAEIVFVTQSL